MNGKQRVSLFVHSEGWHGDALFPDEEGGQRVKEEVITARER